MNNSDALNIFYSKKDIKQILKWDFVTTMAQGVLPFKYET